MNVVSRQRLVEFWSKHPRAEGPLTAWFKLVKKAEWHGTHDVREQFNTADFVGDNRVIFDIGGNKYRVVVRVSYAFKQVLVKFVGTHAEYDQIDPAKV